jgi:hypothetical protein
MDSALGNYLVNGLWPRIRRGEASEAILKQAGEILGVMDIRHRSSGADNMQAIIDYVNEHGRMPTAIPGQPAEAVKLARWASSQVKGLLETKQDTARERHEMILRLRQSHPAGAAAVARRKGSTGRPSVTDAGRLLTRRGGAGLPHMGSVNGHGFRSAVRFPEAAERGGWSQPRLPIRRWLRSYRSGRSSRAASCRRNGRPDW